MKNILITVSIAAAAFVGIGFVAADAEAKRLGGGKSLGMTRNTTAAPSQQAVPPKPAAPAQQAAPAQANPAAAAAPAAAQAAGKRSWLGPLAGLAAGIGLAALLSHFGMGEGVANFLMIALLAMAAIFVVRLLFRKRAPQDGMQYAGAGAGLDAGMPRTEPMRFEPAKVGADASAPLSSNVAGSGIPADFDTEGFLRQAKLNFVRLQAANDRGDMDDIKNFTAPEIFAEVQMQYEERGRTPQRTDVVQLDAALLEVATEGNQHIASVRFHGQLREESSTASVAFDEIWHLTKPVEGGRGWLVAGIQQIG